MRFAEEVAIVGSNAMADSDGVRDKGLQRRGEGPSGAVLAAMRLPPRGRWGSLRKGAEGASARFGSATSAQTAQRLAGKRDVGEVVPSFICPIAKVTLLKGDTIL